MRRNSLVIWAVLAILAGCQGDDFGKGQPVSSGQAIAFSVASAPVQSQDATTKSEETDSQYMTLTSEDGQKLILKVTEVDGIRSGVSQPTTKGVLVSDDTAPSVYGGADSKNAIAVRAIWSSAPDTPFMDDYLVYNVSAAENLQWTPAGGTYYWPKTGSLDFWAWAPREIDADKYDVKRTFTSSGVISSGTIPFTYDLGAGGGTNDALREPDIVFSRISSATQASKPVVDYEFWHALTGVEFKVSSASLGKLKSISLVDVARSGSCVYNPSLENPFAWTLGEVSATYTQTFGDTQGMSVSTDESNPTLVTPDADGTAFMMLPQQITGNKQKVTIVFNQDGTDMTFTGNIPANTWAAGKTYIYRLRVDGDVEISVDDVVSQNGKVKSDPIVTNVGGATAYIRASIVGYWTTKDGHIIAPWSETDTYGTFVNLPKSTDWFLHTDGFYYYKKPIRHGENVQLFDSYTLSGTLPAYLQDAELQIFIDAQAVMYDNLKANVQDAWGETVASNLSILQAQQES